MTSLGKCLRVSREVSDADWCKAFMCSLANRITGIVGCERLGKSIVPLSYISHQSLVSIRVLRDMRSLPDRLGLKLKGSYCGERKVLYREER